MTLMSAAQRLSTIWWLLPIFGGAGFVVAMVLWPPPSDPRERHLCDRVVDALVHSKDLVEIQRAGIIIRQLNCEIGRRLTENGE